MLNILQCMQVCELQFWKLFTVNETCSVRELLLKIMKIPSTQYLGEKNCSTSNIFNGFTSEYSSLIQCYNFFPFFFYFFTY